MKAHPTWAVSSSDAMLHGAASDVSEPRFNQAREAVLLSREHGAFFLSRAKENLPLAGRYKIADA